MPLLAAAAGAAGTALGLVALGRAAGRTADERQAEDAAEAAASRSACVKRLGVATCLRAGSWVKASRHVALVGGALVIGRRPGAAERSLQLRGANIARGGGCRQGHRALWCNLGHFLAEQPGRGCALGR
ncbi:unnamed protein product [Prorocentrum cordatum]|uniref:Uncharacterized protein n=1 Tax=Prorocentrum cordatum TaxID=2364126 RepID=A0ABN9V4E9_9DINO|nr:unnamed protein product [Polarella glacialis]